MGKCGGLIAAPSTSAASALTTVGPGLLGHVDADVGVVAVSRREERQPLHVVPVQVRQQHGTREQRPSRRSVMRRMPVPASSARIHGPASCAQRDTRRVPADPNELRSGRRGRATNPAEKKPHTVPVASSSASSRR